MHWDGSISFGNVLMFVGLVLTFWSINRAARKEERDTRERQHAENRAALREQTDLLHELGGRTTVLETLMHPIATWWNTSQERRSR